MDVNTVDQAYQQLLTESQQVSSNLQTLAGKLQNANQAGNQDAREWLLDLKQLAIQIQQEQMQMQNLMQSIHGLVNNQMQQMNQQGYGYQQGGMQQGGGMGLFGNLLNSGFGQAIENGIGFGIGDDLINSIF